MKGFIGFTVVAVLALVALSGPALAATTATQTVTYEVTAINSITASGDPGALTINAAVAGSPPTAVTDATTTYAVTTNQSAIKVTGSINTAMPANVTLKVTLVAPTGATSAGAVTLGIVAANLVTGIATLNESALTITYELSATATAGVVASASKTVTLTITA